MILVCWTLSTASVIAVDTDSFAKNTGTTFHWFPIQKQFILVAASDSAKFAIGIPYASVNGQAINLDASPKIEDGHVSIDERDVQKILKLMNEKHETKTSSSAKLATSSAATANAKAASSASVSVAIVKDETAGTREVKTIIIDPGHGGKDSGAQGKNAQEKDIVLSVSKLLKNELEKEGFKVKLTRDKDVFIELGERANLANKWDGDLFMSIHCNAIDATPERKKQVQGYQFYVLRAPENEEDKAIARRENKVASLYGEKNAKEELTPIEWFKLEARLEKYKQNSYMFTEELLKSFEGGKIVKQSNGVGGAGFMVLVGAMMPAVLIELGFISNPDDEAYMMTDKGQKDLAERIAKAVANYKEAVHSYRETLGRQ